MGDGDDWDGCSGSRPSLIQVGAAVPIRLLLENDHSFAPDDVATLATAFEEALRALRLVDREDPATTLVARTIIDLAMRGERDPARLRDAAVASLSK
jgi:hypothetical protein